MAECAKTQPKYSYSEVFQAEDAGIYVQDFGSYNTLLLVKI